MAILVDINVLHKVLKCPDCTNDPYLPVYEYIRNGVGEIVYGGTRYKKELSESHRKLFIELKNKRKICKCCDDEVDKLADKIEAEVNDPDFDDPHLLAIVIVSGSQLVCTDDLRATRFLGRAEIYRSHGGIRPRIITKRTSTKTSKDLVQRYA